MGTQTLSPHMLFVWRRLWSWSASANVRGKGGRRTWGVSQGRKWELGKEKGKAKGEWQGSEAGNAASLAGMGYLILRRRGLASLSCPFLCTLGTSLCFPAPLLRFFFLLSSASCIYIFPFFSSPWAAACAPSFGSARDIRLGCFCLPASCPPAVLRVLMTLTDVVAERIVPPRPSLAWVRACKEPTQSPGSRAAPGAR